MSDENLTHFDVDGRPVMVNVGGKQVTERTAIAEARVAMKQKTKALIEQGQFAKGDVRTIAELAGIMAAKKTSDLIPLCHPLPLTHVSVRSAWAEDGSDDALLILTAEVKTTYQTGVEMEALTACSVAALTVYDMCKAVDRGMSIVSTRLIYKAGGKSGVFDARTRS